MPNSGMKTGFEQFERTGALYRSFRSLRKMRPGLPKDVWRLLQRLYYQATRERSIETFLRYMAALGTVALKKTFFSNQLDKVISLLARYAPQKAPA